MPSNQWFCETIDDEPVAPWPEVHQACRKYRRSIIEVREYNEEREATNLQFAYLHAVVFPALAKFWNTSEEDAEFECKKQWGERWLIKKALGYRFVLSKTVLTSKQCNTWIENIWQGAHRKGCIIAPPDKDWKKTARQMAELRGEPA